MFFSLITIYTLSEEEYKKYKKKEL